MKITSRHMSTNGELILKTMLSWIQPFRNRTWSYHSHYDFEECSAIIIDMDNEEGKQLWSKLGTIHSSLIKVSYSSVLAEYSENPFFLRKPVHFNQLTQLIEDINSSINEGSNKVVVNQTTEQPIDKPINISPTVLETIVNNRTKNIRLDTKGETILINSNHFLFSGTISDEGMYHLLSSDFSSHEISLSEDNTNIENLSRDFSEPLIKTVCQKFNQQLIPPLSDQYHYKLIRWPNFKKNRYHPAYVKIAVALSSKFNDIASISQLCKVSFEEVTTFINICYVLQNLEMKTNEPLPVKKSSAPSAKKGAVAFLGKIRNRLGI